MKYNIKMYNGEIVTIDTGKTEIIYIEIGEYEGKFTTKNKYVRIVLDDGSSKIIHYLEECNFKNLIKEDKNKNKDNMKFISGSRSKAQNNKIIIERITDEV